MKRIIFLLYVMMLSSSFFFVSIARASSESAVKEAFCPAMDKEELYDKNNLKNYKKLVLGKEGWIFRTNVAFKTDFSISEQTRESLRALQKGFKAKGTDFVVLLPPNRGMAAHKYMRSKERKAYGFKDGDEAWKNYRKTLSSLQAEGLNVVGVPYIEGEVDIFYKRDHHWNTIGAKLAAEAVSDFIKTLPSYRTLKKIEYETKRIEENKPYLGAFRGAFKKLCKTKLPPQPIDVFETLPKEAEKGSDALFGEEQRPEVVLFGTSNSAPDPNISNFDGFLKEALSADVLNLSRAGAGVDTSMISYLNSKEFKDNPPKIVIWEVPGYYDINRMNAQVFYQAIPAVRGDCGKEAIAQAENIALKAGHNTLLDQIEDKEISGFGAYYLYLNFSKAISKSFPVTFWNGRYSSKHRFKRSRRYPHDGEFYVFVPDKGWGALSKVTLWAQESMDGVQVDARICKMPEN